MNIIAFFYKIIFKIIYITWFINNCNRFIYIYKLEKIVYSLKQLSLIYNKTEPKFLNELTV